MRGRQSTKFVFPNLGRVQGFVPKVIPQLQAYLDDARGTATPAEYALYDTAAGTGARLGELLGLAEAAFDGRAIHIDRTLRHAGRDPAYGQAKNETWTSRRPLPYEAAEAIFASEKSCDRDL